MRTRLTEEQRREFGPAKVGPAKVGPAKDWGKWRQTRTNRIAKPRRSPAALKLGAPKKPAE